MSKEELAPLYVKQSALNYWEVTDEFPGLEYCDGRGIIAVGGDYSPQRLLQAYRRGIFPWPHSEEMPIFWHCPVQRYVLRTSELHIPRSLKRVMKKTPFRVTMDTAFSRVINACASRKRPDQHEQATDEGEEETSTWITKDLIEGYCRLHDLGYAHSVEAWLEDELVGGFYGIAIGRMFYGESMFTYVSDASKVAFVHFVEWLHRHDFPLIDCQAYTEHLARFGAKHCLRSTFLKRVEELTALQPLSGPWSKYSCVRAN
ncbi:MAG: leucyl/phenylalanyl-tRNA--protein transferase [Bradymonadales bacterium]|jgi:leucyl/phenylalanyl-tRNA--protein transferase